VSCKLSFFFFFFFFFSTEDSETGKTANFPDSYQCYLFYCQFISALVIFIAMVLAGKNTKLSNSDHYE